MKIAVIVAMHKELELLLPLLGADIAKVTVNDNTYYQGLVGTREVIAVQCGIGKVNAAVTTLTLIDNFHPSLVINTGVAGGTGRGLAMGDVVVADAVAYHDVWCGPGTELGQAAGCPAMFDCALPASLVAALGDVKTGLVASGDIFVARRQDVDRILELYPQALAVDMESAAIAQVCHLKNVPFVCIRVVSDTPGAVADNAAQYDAFWADAPARTFNVMHRLLAQL